MKGHVVFGHDKITGQRTFLFHFPKHNRKHYQYILEVALLTCPGIDNHVHDVNEITEVINEEPQPRIRVV